MKKLIVITTIIIMTMFACSNQKPEPAVTENNVAVETLTREEIKARSFSELFDTIAIEDIPGDVFTLINKDFAILTAGTPSHYNSMVAS
jgi:hypothetical protein